MVEQPKQVVIRVEDGPQPTAPTSVPVRQHIRRGFKKVGGALSKPIKKRMAQARQPELPPELKQLAMDADDLASLLERLE